MYGGVRRGFAVEQASSLFEESTGKMPVPREELALPPSLTTLPEGSMSDTSMRLALSFALATLVVPAPGDEPKKADPAKLPPPAKMTAQEDHKRMLELLKIKKLRPGPSSRSTNYDEAKANPYPKLPDALVLKDGKKVTTAAMWAKR